MNLKELKEKALKATPGPWKHRTDGEFGSGVGQGSGEHCVETIYNHGNRSYSRDIAVAAHGYSYQNTGGNWKNMDYIAAASPDVILALIEALESTKKQLAKAIEQRDKAVEEICTWNGQVELKRAEAWDREHDAELDAIARGEK